MKKTISNINGTLTTLFVSILFLAAAAMANAATLTVDTTADNSAFSACTNGANDCSLRGAIASAISGDTINFDGSVFASVQTITLGGTDLVLSKNLTITGTGANLLTINGNAASRIFELTNGFTVVIEKMTITNGKTATSGTTVSQRGGAIYLSTGGNLTLNNMVISNNQANLTGGAIYITGTGVVNINNSTLSGNTAGGGGGGIQQSNGAINVTNSIITSNAAPNGGGIYSFSRSPITLTNSTVSNNNATNGSGGGILRDYNPGVSGYFLIIKNSTVNDNSAANGFGGGIAVVDTFGDGASRNLIQNSTISGNTSTGSGGGFYVVGDGADFINSTVTNNNAGGANGGGIFCENSVSAAKLLNTIIAGNQAAANPDIYDNGSGNGIIISYGNNLIGNQGGATMTPAGGDQIGTSANSINARLEPLGNYGGAKIGASGDNIQTHALLSNSPAKDAGSNCVTTSTCATLNPQGNLTTDERGASRVGAVDTGAFEYNTTNFTAALPDGKVNQPYNQTLVPNTTQNGITYSYCYTGTLPPGVSGVPSCAANFAVQTSKSAKFQKITDSVIAAPTAAILISGTPTMGGTFNFALTATDGSGSFGTTNYSINIAARPTAANVTIGGRALTADGRGIVNARITLTDSNGNLRTTTTSTFGYYRFNGVTAGSTCILNAVAKRFTFNQSSQVLNINEDMDEVNFIGN